MSDLETSDRKPCTFRVYLTEDERHAVKILAALRQIKEREFFEDAMKSHIEERKMAEKDGTVFDYRNVPRSAVSISIYADGGLADLVDKWALADDERKDSAFYTAISKYIEIQEESEKKAIESASEFARPK